MHFFSLRSLENSLVLSFFCIQQRPFSLESTMRARFSHFPSLTRKSGSLGFSPTAGSFTAPGPCTNGAGSCSTARWGGRAEPVCALRVALGVARAAQAPAPPRRRRRRGERAAAAGPLSPAAGPARLTKFSYFLVVFRVSTWGSKFNSY